MLFDMKSKSGTCCRFCGKNSLGNISESMPGPVSVILTTISSLFGTAAAVTVPSLNQMEAYLCVGCKELLVREVIERVIAKNVPFEMLNN
jgi:hypothetical protein